MPNQDLPSLQLFESWIQEKLGLEASVLSITPVDGGMSNLTCRVQLDGRGPAAVCLRMQRERGIFEPYDVIREGRVLQALQATGIPVPKLLGGEPSASALGAPFIVTEWIDAPHMGKAGAEADYGEFVRMVVRIHQLDWESYGLAFLGRSPDIQSAIRKELDVIAARMASFGCDDDPGLVRALDVLRSTAPADGTAGLCQGDVNVFNYLFRAGRCVGVVDWEQARLSDTRGDVGQLIALSHLKGMPFGDVRSAPFVQAYEMVAGTQLSGMEYFHGRWAFELAVIARGFLALYGEEPWFSVAQVDDLLGQSIAELE